MKSRGSYTPQQVFPPRILGSIWLWSIMSVGLVVVPTADARIGRGGLEATSHDNDDDNKASRNGTQNEISLQQQQQQLQQQQHVNNNNEPLLPMIFFSSVEDEDRTKEPIMSEEVLNMLLLESSNDHDDVSSASSNNAMSMKEGERGRRHHRHRPIISGGNENMDDLNNIIQKKATSTSKAVPSRPQRKEKKNPPHHSLASDHPQHQQQQTEQLQLHPLRSSPSPVVASSSSANVAADVATMATAAATASPDDDEQQSSSSSSSSSIGVVLAGAALHNAANRTPRNIGHHHNNNLESNVDDDGDDRIRTQDGVGGTATQTRTRRRMKLTANNLYTSASTSSSSNSKPSSNVLITASSKPIVTSIHHGGGVETTTAASDGDGGGRFSPQGHSSGPVCGDGYQDVNEECDFGPDNGHGYCTLDCTLLVNQIPICGNGIREGYEECDWGYYNGYGGKGGCTMDCLKCSHTFQADLSEYLKSFNILRPSTFALSTYSAGGQRWNVASTATSTTVGISSHPQQGQQHDDDGSRNLLSSQQDQEGREYHPSPSLPTKNSFWSQDVKLEEQEEQARFLGPSSSSPSPGPSPYPDIDGSVRAAPPGGWVGLVPTDAPIATPEPAETEGPAPTESPSANPTPPPTPNPTPRPSPNPTKEPTEAPTPRPTPAPSQSPTVPPSPSPTDAPTAKPTPGPTTSPSANPTPEPTPDEPDDTNDDKDEDIDGGNGSASDEDGDGDGDGDDKDEDCIRAADIQGFLNSVEDKEEIQSKPATASSTSCSYEIEVDGKPASDGECIESQSSSGVSGDISGSDSSNVVVWDEDAPCDSGEKYIHFAGSGTFQAMTAGAGETVHTYKAAVFSDGLPIDEGSSGCTTFSPTSTSCEISWKVARDGSTCPSRRLQILQKSEEIIDKKNTIIIDGVEHRICKPDEEPDGKDSVEESSETDFTEDKDKDKDEIDREESWDGSDDTNNGGDKDDISRSDSCEQGDPAYTKVSFTIDTDWYSPLENSVYLVNENALDDPVILAEPINSFRPQAGYNFSTCLPNDGCFEFYVFDSAMDGFQNGSGFGLDVDGQTLLDNLGSNQNGTYENYESFWGVKFGSGCKYKEGEEIAEGGVLPFISELVKSVRDWFGEGNNPPPALEGEGDGSSS